MCSPTTGQTTKRKICNTKSRSALKCKSTSTWWRPMNPSETDNYKSDRGRLGWGNTPKKFMQGKIAEKRTIKQNNSRKQIPAQETVGTKIFMQAKKKCPPPSPITFLMVCHSCANNQESSRGWFVHLSIPSVSPQLSKPYDLKTFINFRLGLVR